MAEMNSRGLVAVSSMGKIKTVIQMIAILVLLANPPNIAMPWVIVGYICLYCASIMTLWSMINYVQAAWPTLTGEKNLDVET